MTQSLLEKDVLNYFFNPNNVFSFGVYSFWYYLFISFGICVNVMPTPYYGRSSIFSISRAYTILLCSYPITKKITLIIAHVCYRKCCYISKVIFEKKNE